MRIFVFILILILFAFPLTAAAGSGPLPAREPVYVCPMHPHIHGKKGDTCPICGMDLVPQTPDGSSAAPGNDVHAEQGTIHIEPTYRQALGVRIAPASLHEFGKTIRAFGHIAPSTRLEHTVAVRTAGWIVDLKADAVGDTVKKGDLLFTYYSPDLMTAQSDFLIGNRAGNTEQRLRLHGMDDKAIAELRKKGRFLEETPFYSPADGAISALNARDGAYMEEGDIVLALQDYTQIWVQAYIPSRDMPLLPAGTPATITADETGETLKASVDLVYPVIDPQSRDGAVRLVLGNPEGRLKAGMLVNVAFETGSRSRLAVPAEAVLYGKNGGYVIEATGNGYFRPVAVNTGITAHGMTEIISGLTEGQSVVTSGQFMIDAESSLSGGMAGMTGGEEAGNVHKH